MRDGYLVVIDSIFTNNQAAPLGPDTGGGAIYVLGSKGGVWIVGSTFTGNQASNAGAVGGLFAELNVYNSLFSNNKATGHDANGDDPDECDEENNDQNQVGSGGNGGALYSDGTGVDVILCGDAILNNAAGTRAFGGGPLLHEQRLHRHPHHQGHDDLRQHRWLLDPDGDRAASRTQAPRSAPTARASRSRTPTGSRAEAVALGDLDGDGRRDVALTTSVAADPANDRMLNVFLQDVDGTLKPRVQYPLGNGTPRALDIGDVNGDGRADAVVGNSAGAASSILVLLQNSSGTLDAPVAYPTLSADHVKVGDFNGDGRMDVAGLNCGQPRRRAGRVLADRGRDAGAAGDLSRPARRR